MDRESRVPGAGKRAVESITRCAKDDRYPRVQVYPEVSLQNTNRTVYTDSGLSPLPLRPILTPAVSPSLNETPW